MMSTDFLEIGHHADVSSSALVFRTNTKMPSGPVAFLVHVRLNSVWTLSRLITGLGSCSVIEIVSIMSLFQERNLGFQVSSCSAPLQIAGHRRY